jgi:hypothetical protein
VATHPAVTADDPPISAVRRALDAIAMSIFEAG